MPISPDEAASGNLKMVQDQLIKTFGYLDDQLRKHYYGEKAVVATCGSLNSRVVAKVIAAYRAVGWNVRHKCSSHRNEESNSFTFERTRTDMPPVDLNRYNAPS